MGAEPKTNARGKALRVDRSCISNPPKFNPTDDQWADIGKPFRRSLKEADRLQIQKLLNEYLRDEALFVARPFKREAQSHLSEIINPARKLLRAINQRDPAALYARDLICEPTVIDQAAQNTAEPIELLAEDPVIAIFRVGPSKGSEAMLDLHVGMYSLIGACKRAADRIEQPVRWPDPWHEMIRSLREFAVGRGYPSGASKGGRSSPFVKFVEALQNTLPGAFRHHDRTDGALAKAIADAGPISEETRGTLSA